MREPTNGELKIMLDDLKSSINDIKASVAQTLVQTQKTNGRVNKLEWWRTAIVSIFGAICVFIGFIFPYGIALGKSAIQQTINSTLNQSLNNALNTYDSTLRNTLESYDIKVTN